MTIATRKKQFQTNDLYSYNSQWDLLIMISDIICCYNCFNLHSPVQWDIVGTYIYVVMNVEFWYLGQQQLLDTSLSYCKKKSLLNLVK